MSLSKKSSFSRRDVIKFGLTGSMLLGLSRNFPRVAARAEAVREPHFFIQVLYQGGIDHSYLFDARPLALTRAGKIQNYLGEEPTEWVGANGVKTLATRLVNPLLPFKSDFTVINGVMMASNFDGHDQNTNFLLTGNPFGGDSFIPHLNEGLQSAPLDYTLSGVLLADLLNTAAGVPLNPNAAKTFVEKLKSSDLGDDSEFGLEYALARIEANARGEGGFSLGTAALQKAMLRAPDLESRLKSLDLSAISDTNPSTETSIVPDLVLMSQCFQKGIARSAVIAPQFNLDVHAAEGAKELPKELEKIIDQLVTIFKFLKETPYDTNRSLLDVTTVVVSSEFGRTMRQTYADSIAETGTDHNPLSNSVLVAGKGIRGGLVVGATDFKTDGETLSGAHLSLDRESVKIMGLPFDFNTSTIRTDRPQSFSATDYLTYHSLVNSLYAAFGVSDKHYRAVERNGPVAPVLQSILG